MNALLKCLCICHCLCYCLFLVRSCVLITLIKCLKAHKSLGSLFECALEMYLSLILCLSLSLCLSLYLSCLFFGRVMSLHHSDQISQKSQVSGVALFRCSQNVFVFVIVFVFVFVILFFWSGHVPSSL